MDEVRYPYGEDSSSADDVVAWLPPWPVDDPPQEVISSFAPANLSQRRRDAKETRMRNGCSLRLCDFARDKLHVVSYEEPSVSLLILLPIIFAASLLLTMVGLGGGLIFSPLFILLQFPVHTAVSASLFLNGIAAISAAISYFRKKMVDVKIGLPLIIYSSIFAPLGAYATFKINLRLFYPERNRLPARTWQHPDIHCTKYTSLCANHRIASV